MDDRFYGVAHQRGHGFGSIWRGLWRIVKPLVRSSARAVGKQALRSGADLMGDIARGENVAGALRARAEEGGRSLAGLAQKNLEEMVARQQQSGSGRRRKLMSSMNPATLAYRPTPAKRRKSSKTARKTRRNPKKQARKKSSKRKKTKSRKFNLKTVF